MNGYETEELQKAHIEALLRELDGLERIGDKAGAEAVKKSLRAFGHKVAAPAAEKAERRPAKPEAEKRA